MLFRSWDVHFIAIGNHFTEGAGARTTRDHQRLPATFLTPEDGDGPDDLAVAATGRARVALNLPAAINEVGLTGLTSQQRAGHALQLLDHTRGAHGLPGRGPQRCDGTETGASRQRGQGSLGRQGASGGVGIGSTAGGSACRSGRGSSGCRGTGGSCLTAFAPSRGSALLCHSLAGIVRRALSGTDLRSSLLPGPGILCPGGLLNRLNTLVS